MSSTLLLYYDSLKMDMLLISLHSFGCFTSVAYVGFTLPMHQETAGYGSPYYSIMSAFDLTVANSETSAGDERVGIYSHFSVDNTRETHMFTQTHRSKFSVGSAWRSPFMDLLLKLSKVIRTRNVHHLSFSMSALLTLGAFVSFCHGFLSNDFFITVSSNFSFALKTTPHYGILSDNIFIILQVFNILRFLLGIVQMRLYFSYRNSSAPIYWDAGSVGNDNSSEEISRSVPEEISTRVQAVEVDGSESASVNISMELALC
ncbi:hypothetical protein SAY87_021821 [Trapa incisa]|uniref:Uncharacterized protein n=1 Tax=Trapa incisa TaxID=236973 RepID=A0AAN7JXM4_9MYRT|nr:hypothetical protein SAY87_021821 [Trapa incisa]